MRATSGSGSVVVLVEELDDARRVGEVLLALEQPEGAGAAREDVHAAVLHALEDLVDRTGAADRLELVLGHPDDPELALLSQAVLDHRAVAILEDVQRHALGRQRDDPQREERKAL